MAYTRVIPLTCGDVYRQAAENQNKILPNELHSTSDHRRLFLEGYHIAPVWHGQIETQAAMLALSAGAERSVFPMDMCFRLDTNSVWMCIGGRGTSLSQWLELTGATAVEVDDIVDGGDASAELENVIDGGDAGDEFTDDVDGNPEI